MQSRFRNCHSIGAKPRGKFAALLPLTAGALLLAVAGCASEARLSAMVVDVDEETLIAEDSPLFEAVELEAVSGGEETNPMWMSEVGNPEYEEALRLSLANHAMLAEKDGRFALTAELLEVDQPIMGFDMEVTSVAKYTLIEINSGDTVFIEVVTTPYTADFSSTFLGAERLRLANEGAMRENIRAFLKLMIEKSKTEAPAISMEELTIASVAVADRRATRRQDRGR